MSAVQLTVSIRTVAPLTVSSHENTPTGAVSRAITTPAHYYSGAEFLISAFTYNNNNNNNTVQ